MKFLTSPLKPILLASCLAAFSLGAQAIGAGEHCAGRAMHFEASPEGHGMPPFLGRLKLSEAQRDQLFKNMHEEAPLMREKFKEAHKAREALRSLAFSDQYDEGKASALAESEARAMAELAKMRARSAHQTYLVLNPEQRKQFEEMKSDFDKRPSRHRREGLQGQD